MKNVSFSRLLPASPLRAHLNPFRADWHSSHKFFRTSGSHKYARPSGHPPPVSGMTYADHPPSTPDGPASQYYSQGPQYPTQSYHPPPGPPPQQNRVSYGAPAQGGEDPFAMLSRYDTVVLVDDSGSMEMFWDETREALIGLVAKSIQYDSDGIDVHFFNDAHASTYGCRTTQQVQEVFRRVEPRRSTPTANALKRVLDPYLKKLYESKAIGAQIKPMNLIVLTDGAPDRGQDPEHVIVEVGQFLDAGRYPLSQLGISFIQIGNDEQASRHLAALDDDLRAKHRIRDFVDCTPFKASDSSRLQSISTEFILKALLGGVNRKVDRQHY